jgi:hypothetical protein
MAGGTLVPHQLPDGRMIQVPDYLAPRGVGAPMDMGAAVAGPGGGPMAQWGNEIPYLPDPTPEEKQASDVAAIRGALAPKAPGPDGPSHTTKPEPSKFETVGKKAGDGGGVDPSTLHRPGQRGPGAQQSGPPAGSLEASMRDNPVLARVFAEGGRGGGAARPGGMAPSQIVEEREPGKELLPELQWRYGLASRPDLGQEVDPNADQPTWGDAEPVMRARKTGLERGAEAAGESGRQQFEQQELLRQMQAVTQKDALLQHSEALDQQLAAVAEKREQVASLQALAEKRANEAASVEPRTRAEIWQSKGALAQGMGILSMALGGMIQATRGGPNPAAEIINKWLDDSVDDDRYRFERAQKLSLDAKNDFSRAMSAYGDLDLAALDVKQRKIASAMAMANQMMADKALDDTAKMRGAAVVQDLQNQYLQNAQAMQDMITGKVTKQQVTMKPQMVGGGGGGDRDTLARLKRAAEAKKAMDTITGADDKPKLNPTEEAAMNAEEADMVPLKEMLHRYRNQDSIPGVGGRNIVSKGVRGLADTVAGEGSGSRLMDSKEERANRLIVERAALAYRHKMTGAGGSAKEMEGIDQAFAGARTKEDLEEAIRVSEAALAERRRLAAGGRSRAGDRPQRAESEEADR